MHLNSRSALLASALLLAATLSVTLSACDALTQNELTEPALMLAPIPEGATLLGSTAPGLGGAALGKTGFMPDGASAYGCLVSTPDPTGEHAYRYRAFYLSFPEDVLAEADGQSETVTLTLGSQTLLAETPRDWPVVVRRAQCLLPKSDAARQMVRDQLRRIDVSALPETWQGEPAEHPDGAASSLGKAGSWECMSWWVEQVCSQDAEGNLHSCVTTKVECTHWQYISAWEPIGGDGPGGGWNGGGDDDDPCAPAENGGIPFGCGGGGGPTFPDEDPCETDDEVIDQLAAAGELDAIWEASNADAPALERRERGRWIVRGANGDLAFVDIGGQSMECGINTGPMPTNAVGFVHTHPFGIGENNVGCALQELIDDGIPMAMVDMMRSGQIALTTDKIYTGGPSGFDRDALGAIRTQMRTQGDMSEPIGVMIDKNGVHRFGETPDHPEGASYEPCGYDVAP